MSADIERHAYRPGGNLNRCAECYCPRSHSIHQVTAHDAHIAAIGGRCSHGGHGWEDTCSDIDDALASPGAMHRGGCTSDAPPLECPVCA